VCSSFPALDADRARPIACGRWSCRRLRNHRRAPARDRSRSHHASRGVPAQPFPRDREPSPVPGRGPL